MSFINEGMVRETAVDDTIFLDGFEDCIVTVVESFHGRHVVYNQQKVIQKLMSRDGMDREEAVEQPYVDAELCIGCGICQNKCPVSDQAAIRVTSVGETRNFNNQFLTADRYSG